MSKEVGLDCVLVLPAWAGEIFSSVVEVWSRGPALVDLDHLNFPQPVGPCVELVAAAGGYLGWAGKPLSDELDGMPGDAI